MTPERYATVEWQVEDGPRHIERYLWRKSGDYRDLLPFDATILNVWGRGASDEHDRSEQDD